MSSTRAEEVGIKVSSEESYSWWRAPIERRNLISSFLTFTALLAAYYILRPARDALAATLGADSIKYLSSGVFAMMLLIVPIFGWLTLRVPRRWLVPALYAFFILDLVAFAVAFGHSANGGSLTGWWARAFYLWVTVFSLFAVSIFWSRMADVWNERQGRRYFGVISAGGSLGGLIGPLLARVLVVHVAIGGLIWISAGLLAGSCAGSMLLVTTRGENLEGQSAAVEPSGAAVLAGIWLIGRTPFLSGIAALVCLGSFLGMLVYIEMARAVASAFPDAVARTAFYSSRDLVVNAAAFVLQLFVVGRVTQRLGVGIALIVSGSIVLGAFVYLGLSPTLTTLTTVSVLLRCTEFGVAKPARDMLYTVVSPAAKYQSKNVIDTAVYRGSDMASGWMQSAIATLGVSLGDWGWIGGGVSAVLVGAATLVGRGYRRRGGK